MTPLTDKSPMLFGLHKGKALANVPDEYLLWLYEQMKDRVFSEGHPNKPMQDYLNENIEAIRKVVKGAQYEKAQEAKVRPYPNQHRNKR